MSDARAKKLPNELGFQPDVTLEEEISRMLDLIVRSDIMMRLKAVEHVIRPRTWWSGDKREVETLEAYIPGTKNEGGYTPTLHTGKRDLLRSQAEDTEAIEFPKMTQAIEDDG